MGCDAVLINTAIAKAKNPYQMAESMKYAVISGRKSFLSGRITPSIQGSVSSPKKFGLILPDKYDFLPDITASFIASAI